MSIKYTAVSYYGLNYVEHAKRDFEEMTDHGCDTVILAITEFDILIQPHRASGCRFSYPGRSLFYNKQTGG